MTSPAERFYSEHTDEQLISLFRQLQDQTVAKSLDMADAAELAQQVGRAPNVADINDWMRLSILAMTVIGVADEIVTRQQKAADQS